MIYFVIFFTSLVLTIFFTPLMIDFLTKKRIVDIPGEPRRINKYIVPRMGGILIYIIAIVSTISFFGDLNSIRFFVISSIIITLLGIADDMDDVLWNHKFVIQFIMAFFLVYFLAQDFEAVHFFGIDLYFPFNYIILILFIVGTINSINLLDGLDGLVSGFSLMVVFLTFLIGFDSENLFLLVLSSSLMGTLIGFLKFNAHPARIFLGDTGAYVLGFFLVTSTVVASTDPVSRSMDLTFPVILLALPIIDAIKVMIIRFINNRNPFMADMSHIHHIIIGKVRSQKITVFIIENIALLYAAVSLYYIRGDKETAMIIFGLLSVPLIFIEQVVKIFRKPSYPDILKKVYQQFPQIFINAYTKFIVPLVAITSLSLLIGLTPLKSDTSEMIIMLSLLFIILLFVYSLFHYQRNRYFNDILVFFNIILFLLYSNYSEHINISGIFAINSDSLIIFMILPAIGFFFFFREKIINKKVPLFSGIDLIILVFIILLSVSSNLLPVKQFANTNIVIFNSFLLYIFYKVFVILRERYQPVLFYLSFIVPVFALIRLLVL